MPWIPKNWRISVIWKVPFGMHYAQLLILFFKEPLEQKVFNFPDVCVLHILTRISSE